MQGPTDRRLTPALLSSRFANADAIAGLAASQRARPVRFLIVGGVTFALNLGLLMLFTSLGLGSIVAYAIALALSVQFNFVVNQLLVWHDRPLPLAAGPIIARWTSFHAWIALSLVVNLVAFSVAQLFMPDVAAAFVAVAASTGFKFVSLDRFAFRGDRPA